MKITRKQSILDFIFELLFGLFITLATILMNEPFSFLQDLPIFIGLGSVIYYFIRKRSLDERDYMLFYKINHLTLGTIIFAIATLRLIGDNLELSKFMSLYWSQLLISTFFFFHGIFGLVLFLKK